MENLNVFLKNNNIDKVKIEAELYQCIILSIFEKIYNYLEKGNNKVELKDRMRKCNSNREENAMFRKYLDNITKVTLTEKEIDYLQNLTKAYLRKSSYRKRVSNKEKNSIIMRQGHKCSICNTQISINNCHIDHIIPFKYVGDELENNYQALCEACNWSKSANLYYYYDAYIV